MTRAAGKAPGPEVCFLRGDALRTPWGPDDRAWFAARPERAHRVRPVYPGEFLPMETPPGQGWFAIVRQIAPGARLRRPMQLNRPGDMGEIEAHALFDMAEETRETRPLMAEEFAARVAALRKARERVQ